MNRWLSPELVAAVDPQLAAPRATGGSSLAIPGNRAVPTRGWERQSNTRVSRIVSTLALRAAVAILLGACAAFSYVALSEAAASLRQKSSIPVVEQTPAPERAPHSADTDRAALAAEKLAPAKARVHSLREANYLMRIRLSELEAALEEPVIVPDAEGPPGTQAPEASTSEG